MSECLHPEHSEASPRRDGVLSRCLCYDCLIDRDARIGDAIERIYKDAHEQTALVLIDRINLERDRLWARAAIRQGDR